jgi:hypothetical protein
MSGEKAGPTASEFHPFLLGYLVEGARACWDVQPLHQQTSVNVGNLLVSLEMGSELQVRIAADIYVSAIHPKYGEATFEWPREVFLVKSKRKVLPTNSAVSFET